MNLLAMYLISNQFWYGFFAGSLFVLGLALLVVAMLRARKGSRR